jgi:hypothetical protein
VFIVAGVRATVALLVNAVGIPVLAVDEDGNVGVFGRVFSSLDQSTLESVVEAERPV